MSHYAIVVIVSHFCLIHKQISLIQLYLKKELVA